MRAGVLTIASPAPTRGSRFAMPCAVLVHNICTCYHVPREEESGDTLAKDSNFLCPFYRQAKDPTSCHV